MAPRYGFFSQALQLAVADTLSPDTRQKALAVEARRLRDETIKSGQGSPLFRTIVDRKEGVPEEAVNPENGEIRYLFNHMPDVVRDAITLLIMRSPPRSGRPDNPRTGKFGSYRDNFYVSVNGNFEMAESFDQSKVEMGQTVYIGNTAPYARKVDVQLIGTKKLSFSVPPHIFDDVVDELKRRYGNIARFWRHYTRTFPGQNRLRQAQMRSDAPHRVKRSAGQLVESPVLVIEPIRLT